MSICARRAMCVCVYVSTSASLFKLVIIFIIITYKTTNNSWKCKRRNGDNGEERAKRRDRDEQVTNGMNERRITVQPSTSSYFGFIHLFLFTFNGCLNIDFEWKWNRKRSKPLEFHGAPSIWFGGAAFVVIAIIISSEHVKNKIVKLLIIKSFCNLLFPDFSLIAKKALTHTHTRKIFVMKMKTEQKNISNKH